MASTVDYLENFIYGGWSCISGRRIQRCKFIKGDKNDPYNFLLCREYRWNQATRKYDGSSPVITVFKDGMVVADTNLIRQYYPRNRFNILSMFDKHCTRVKYIGSKQVWKPKISNKSIALGESTNTIGSDDLQEWVERSLV